MAIVELSFKSIMMMGSDVGNTVIFYDYKLTNGSEKFLLNFSLND